MKKAIPSFLLLYFFHLPLLAQFDLIGSGRAIQFDGVDDYVDMGDIYDDLTFPLSVSAWVYAQPSSRYMLPVFVSQDNAPLYNGFWFCMTSTNLFFEYGDGRGDQNSAYRRGKSADVSNLQGRWIHVAAVVRGASDIQLYVNGHDVGGAYTGSSSFPMASDYPGDVAKAGYFYTNAATHRFYGLMDELRVWNRSLSQYEIRDMMCRRLNGSESGLIGYWNFDETSGDVAYDLSASKFNGALLGNPSRVYSGAPIGDESKFLYTSNWSVAELAHDDLMVSKVSGNVYGVHTYLVNSLPSQTGGLDASTLEPPYYGVFLADDGGTNTFDFSFQEGVVCAVYKRLDNSVSNWSPSGSFTAIRTRLEVIPTFEASELDIDIGADSIFFCNETSHTLEAGAESAGLTFLWSTGETTPAITVTTSGTFSLRVTSGCQIDYDSIKISFLSPPPAFSLGQDVTVCNVEPRLLVTDLQASDYDFTWQDDSKEPHYLLTEFGNYWLKVQNPCGYSVDSIRINPVQEPDIDIKLGSDVTICDQSSYRLAPSFVSGAKTFLWNTGHSTREISVNTPGLYILEGRGECKTDKDSVYVNFLSNPPAFSLGEDQELCAFKPITLSVIQSQDYDLTWQDGSNGPSLQANTFGTYWLRIENMCGVSTDTVTFTQKFLGDFKFFNFISPDNQDNLNQYFVVDELLAGSHLAIFNRWGKLLYESYDYGNNWDGDDLPTGVYYYTIRGECFEPIKGTITINR